MINAMLAGSKCKFANIQASSNAKANNKSINTYTSQALAERVFTRLKLFLPLTKGIADDFELLDDESFDCEFVEAFASVFLFTESLIVIIFC